MTKNFSNLGKDLDVQVHEANRSHYLNLRQSSPRHIIIKLLKKKERENAKGIKRKDCKLTK